MHILETERLLFRHHEPADLEPYCEMESDPEYRRSQVVHPRAELERSFREGWLPPKPMGLLATVYKPEGRYIGRCGLYPCRRDDGEVIPGEARLAFYLARPFWGRWLATEAGRATPSGPWCYAAGGYALARMFDPGRALAGDRVVCRRGLQPVGLLTLSIRQEDEKSWKSPGIIGDFLVPFRAGSKPVGRFPSTGRQPLFLGRVAAASHFSDF